QLGLPSELFGAIENCRFLVASLPRDDKRNKICDLKCAICDLLPTRHFQHCLFRRAGDSSAILLTALCGSRPKVRIKNLLNFADIQSVLQHAKEAQARKAR